MRLVVRNEVRSRGEEPSCLMCFFLKKKKKECPIWWVDQSKKIKILYSRILVFQLVMVQFLLSGGNVFLIRYTNVYFDRCIVYF